MRDPWEVLGAEPGASPHEVRSAWRAAVRRTHPDIGGSVAAFKEVQAAWASLQSEEGRAARGRGRTNTAPPNQPWDHARAVRHLVGLDFDFDFDDTDDGITGVAGSDGVVWLSDSDLECEEVAIPWSDVDDSIMSDVVDVLRGCAR
jgi:curved DNA-binding protein CbpA